jgi:HlyD family secretion protein
VNGTVISRNVDVGQTVAASLQAPTLFTIAKDLTQMQVNANVSEADIGRIVRGQEAIFTVDAYPERKFRGSVSEVRNAPITIQNVVTYDVVIQVGNKDLKLKPGMTANVSVMIDRKEGVLKIPNAALRFRPASSKKTEGGEKRKEGLKQMRPSTDEGGRPGSVWVLSQEGKPVEIALALGITNGTFSEVTSGDLKEGMEVIVEETSSKKSSAQSGSPSPFTGGRRR